MKKLFGEFPTKFWVILGLTFLLTAFAFSIGLDYVEIGEMGIKLTQ
ncbi:MAG: hypothetical protein ACOC22_01170 [bacterium]